MAITLFRVGGSNGRHIPTQIQEHVMKAIAKKIAVKKGPVLATKYRGGYGRGGRR